MKFWAKKASFFDNFHQKWQNFENHMTKWAYFRKEAIFEEIFHKNSLSFSQGWLKFSNFSTRKAYHFKFRAKEADFRKKSPIFYAFSDDYPNDIRISSTTLGYSYENWPHFPQKERFSCSKIRKFGSSLRKIRLSSRKLAIFTQNSQKLNFFS